MEFKLYFNSLKKTSISSGLLLKKPLRVTAILCIVFIQPLHCIQRCINIHDVDLIFIFTERYVIMQTDVYY